MGFKGLRREQDDTVMETGEIMGVSWAALRRVGELYVRLQTRCAWTPWQEEAIGEMRDHHAWADTQLGKGRRELHSSGKVKRRGVEMA